MMIPIVFLLVVHAHQGFALKTAEIADFRETSASSEHLEWFNLFCHYLIKISSSYQSVGFSPLLPQLFVARFQFFGPVCNMKSSFLYKAMCVRVPCSSL